ncbi:MAG: SIMPL domain-containing protein, partial [Candidatus Pacebacteria bacterium]|nr:SIMPL domain-containing protein [Candidatus Paceibacterota bacterium]
MEIPQENKKRIYKVVSILGIILCFYFGVKFLSELRSYNMMGSNGANIITVTGEGEVSAVPDISGVNFTIRKEAKTVKEAQDAVAEIEKKALEFIRSKNVQDK